MQTYTIVAVTAANNTPLPGASVSVYLTGTTTLTALYDSVGTPIANPMFADQNGIAVFQVVDGTYDIVAQSGSYVGPTRIKAQIYDLALIAAGSGGAGNGYLTLASLNADLSPGDGALAQVVQDPVAANNGTYLKIGATNTGSWLQVSVLSLVELENQLLSLTTVVNLQGGTLTTLNFTVASLSLTVATQGTNLTALTNAVSALSSALTPLPADDGIGFADKLGNDSGLRAYPTGPEIGGLRITGGSCAPFAFIDRFGYALHPGGDYSFDEIRALNAEALAYSALVRAQFDNLSQRATCNYNLFISYGQSLSEGTQPDTTYPIALTTAARFGSLMLGNAPYSATEANTTFDPVGGSSALTPLFSVSGLTTQGYRGEIPIVGILNTLKQAWLQSQSQTTDAARLMIGVACGVGGLNIAELQSGATPNYYGKVSSAITQTAAIAVADVKTICCSGIFFEHGQEDHNDATTRAAYASGLVTLMSTIQGDVIAAFAQPYAPAVFFTQAGGLFEAGEPAPGADARHLPIEMAQIDVADQNPGYYLIGPDYPYPNGASGHLTSNGYRWEGVKAGQVAHDVTVRGRTWKPLQPYKIMARGSTILIAYSVPAPPIQFLPVYVVYTATMFANYGFQAYDDFGPLTILGVKILGSAVVGILCNRQIGNNVGVRYAGSTLFGGKGNLCDSDPYISPDNYVYIAQAFVTAATVNAAGSGGTNGTNVVLTVVGGTGAPARLLGTIAGNVLTAITGVQFCGEYTAFPGTTAIAVTGGGLTGAKVNLTAGGMNAGENIAALVGKPYPMNNWSLVFDKPAN